jgi:hypothetical protein
MNRRNFVGTLAAADVLGAETEKRSRVFLLQQFYLKNGTQKARLDQYLSEGLLPAMAKLSQAPLLCLDGVVAGHLPQMSLISGYRSEEEMRSLREKLHADAAHRKAFEAWERGDEAPYENYSLALLAATDYSPDLTALKPPPKAPRIFELRVYHSPTMRQLAALHERFAGPEIRIFARCGIHPILYSSTAIGPNMPNLTYVIPFDDLAARDKAWAAFGSDPEWVKVRKESIDRSGQISIDSQISLHRATAYSPLR